MTDQDQNRLNQLKAIFVNPDCSKLRAMLTDGFETARALGRGFAEANGSIPMKNLADRLGDVFGVLLIIQDQTPFNARHPIDPTRAMLERHGTSYQDPAGEPARGRTDGEPHHLDDVRFTTTPDAQARTIPVDPPAAPRPEPAAVDAQDVCPPPKTDWDVRPMTVGPVPMTRGIGAEPKPVRDQFSGDAPSKGNQNVPGPGELERRPPPPGGSGGPPPKKPGLF